MLPDARCPDLHIVGAAVWKGSLLVALDVACLGQNKSFSGPDGTAAGMSAEAAAQMLQSISSTQWLRWLGLPCHMEAAVQVGLARMRC